MLTPSLRPDISAPPDDGNVVGQLFDKFIKLEEMRGRREAKVLFKSDADLSSTLYRNAEGLDPALGLMLRDIRST